MTIALAIVAGYLAGSMPFGYWLVRLTKGVDIVAIAQPLKIEASSIQGTAIAFQFTGNDMVYLVVNDNGEQPPQWISENDVTGAYLG